MVHDPRLPGRWFVLGLSNGGSGIAKFPSIRYRRASGLIVDSYGLDGQGFGLPQRPSENEWAAFRGGVDEVVYAGEILKITNLFQPGSNKGPDGLPLPKVFGPNSRPLDQWVFKALTLQCEISCEGMPTLAVQSDLPEYLITWP